MRIFVFIGGVNLFLSSIGYYYYRSNLLTSTNLPFTLGYILLSLNAIFSRALFPILPHFLVKLTALLDGLWLAFGYYSLLYALLHFVLWLFSRLLHVQLPEQRLALIGLVCICAFIAWGSWRAYHPFVRTEKIMTTKLPHATGYRILLLTDIHLGRVLGRSYAETLVERINRLAPDMVLISGDFLDERIEYVESEGSLIPFKNIQAPKGTYLAFGNHDYLDNPKLWQEMVEEAGIRVLRDHSVIVDGQVKITGLNDFSRNRSHNSLKELARGNASFYSVIMDHQPRKMQSAALAGYDLYLAGHTHTGQLFPNRQVTKRMYLLDYGRKEFDRLTAIVSAGYGFWGPPVRTEVASEMVLIEVQGI